MTYKEFVRLCRREPQHSVQGMLNIWRPGQHRDTQPDLATDRQTSQAVSHDLGGKNLTLGGRRESVDAVKVVGSFGESKFDLLFR